MSQQPANREKAAMSTAWLLNNAKTNSPNHILASCGWHFLARQLPYPGRLQSRNWPPNAPESSYMSLLSISKDKTFDEHQDLREGLPTCSESGRECGLSLYLQRLHAEHSFYKACRDQTGKQVLCQTSPKHNRFIHSIFALLAKTQNCCRSCPKALVHPVDMNPHANKVLCSR